MTGRLIVIEGVDASGKSTISKRLAKELNAYWQPFPDRSTFFGFFIDEYLKGNWHVDRHVAGPFNRSLPQGVPEETRHGTRASEDFSTAAAFQAIQTVNRLEVLPKMLSELAARDVVCDRYWMSGYAYGSMDGLPGEVLEQIHRTLPQPDVAIFLDVTPRVSLARMQGRGGKAEFYESRGAEWNAKLREKYLQLFKFKREHIAPPAHWHLIDASGTSDEVYEAVWKVL